MAERGWCGACCDIYYVFWTSLENGKVLKSLHIYLSYACVLQRYWQMALMCSSVWLHRASHPCPQCPGETSWACSGRSCVRRPEHKTIYVLPYRAGSLPLSPHFFFHHLGAILTSIAVQVAVLSFLLPLINVSASPRSSSDDIFTGFPPYTNTIPSHSENIFARKVLKSPVLEIHWLPGSVIIFLYPGKCWLELSQISSCLIRKE